MADIFISYTSSDRDWAFWIAQELEKLGHTPHVYEWEISGGGDIMAWMEERHDKADHVLFVISKVYLTKTYSAWERRAAQWAAMSKRPNFALPVRIEDCELPTLLAHLKFCDLFDIDEDEARKKLKAFLTPATRPSEPTPFPGAAKRAAGEPVKRETVAFPGHALVPGDHGASAQIATNQHASKKTTLGKTLSNIPITVPRFFLGRDEALAAIEAALKQDKGRAAITAALHGMRGVGKTTLAAAYAEQHRGDYRATWWIRAQEPSTLRADLVGLGVRLGWVAADAKEEPALAEVIERLRNEGEGVLLIYDNAQDANGLRDYLPRGGASHVLITSNSPAWLGLAEPVRIGLWPKQIGAEYLIKRTGGTADRAAAEDLSVALGGLPLAHEQAATYCERLGIPLAEYAKRFEATPARLLDAEKDAPAEYHDGLTVAKTFALAIEEATKLHPAAEPLIVHAALLAPEPIPLFLFSEAREKLGEPLASALADDGLDEAVAALRAFALVDREPIADERDPAITTDCIRLHRLVRQVAAARCEGNVREAARGALIAAIAAVYPRGVFNDPKAWPRARRLDALALVLVGGDALLSGTEVNVSHLLDRLAAYRQGPLAAYSEARPLTERALAICEKVLGAEHPATAQSLNSLGLLLKAQGDLAGARPLYERALAIREKALGPEHPATAQSLNNLGILLKTQGDLAGARPLYERALAVGEKTRGPEHPAVATRLNNLALLLQDQGDLAGSRPLFERALAIREKVLGPEHPDMANSLNNLAGLLQDQGDLAGARPLFERALVSREKVLGPEHPDTAASLNNLGGLLLRQGDLAGARPLYERALAIREKVLGPGHPDTAQSLNNLAFLRQALGDLAGARRLIERALAIYEKVLGPEHPRTKNVRNNLASLPRS